MYQHNHAPRGATHPIIRFRRTPPASPPPKTSRPRTPVPPPSPPSRSKTPAAEETPSSAPTPTPGETSHPPAGRADTAPPPAPPGPAPGRWETAPPLARSCASPWAAGSSLGPADARRHSSASPPPPSPASTPAASARRWAGCAVIYARSPGAGGCLSRAASRSRPGLFISRSGMSCFCLVVDGVVEIFVVAVRRVEGRDGVVHQHPVFDD